MKLLILLGLIAAVVAAVQPTQDKAQVLVVEVPETENERNFALNLLVNQMIAYLRRVINNGSPLLGLPPIDPLLLESFHFNIPAGLINLEIDVKNALAKGFGGFIANKSSLNTKDLTFDIAVTVPEIAISAVHYLFLGDLFTAIPLYGDGDARFVLKNFQFGGILHLKQSENEKSVIIEKIEAPFFNFNSLDSEITGAIGGGDIDKIVNSIVSEVVVDYVLRFRNIISRAGADTLTLILNPILNELDTWKYIRPFV